MIARHDRFDRAVTTLDALDDERVWRRARPDLTAPLVAAGLAPGHAGALARELLRVEMR